MIEAEYRVEPNIDQPGPQPSLVRTLPSGELLFCEGEGKSHIYRVESGAICVYEPAAAGHEPFVAFAFSGDWLGLGYLDKHTCRARALVATRVTRFPLASLDALVEENPRARAALADAIEREFEFVRHAVVRCGPPRPIERVAAFLVSVASVNRYEGRDPSIVVDSMRCGVVAECLTLSVDTLASVLIELEKQGLIEPRAPGGLRLKDIAALEALADGLSLDGDTVERAARRRSIVVDYHDVA